MEWWNELFECGAEVLEGTAVVTCEDWRKYPRLKPPLPGADHFAISLLPLVKCQESRLMSPTLPR